MRVAGYQVRRDPVDWEKTAVWCGIVVFVAGCWVAAVWGAAELWRSL